MKHRIELWVLGMGVLLLMLLAAPLTVQSQSNKTYASEDGAVQFTYSDEWTIEVQSQTFNQRYHYELWTRSSELAAYFGNENRSRTALDLLNPREAGYPQAVVTALDYARYTLGEDLLDYSTVKVGSYSAVRAIPAHSAMPPSPSVTVQQNFGPPATTTPMPTNPAPHEGRFYVIVRDDGWVILMNMAAPGDEIQNREAQMLQMVKSLVFDAKAAATPFVRNLETYDVSGITLTQDYSSKDGNLQFQYPTGWTFDAERPINSTLGDPVVIMYAVPLRPPPYDGKQHDAEITISVMNVTNDGMDLPADQNTGEEFMQYTRQSTEGEIAQFRIGQFDAVSGIVASDGGGVIELIAFAANHTWVVMGIIDAPDRETAKHYEAGTVAILASLRLAPGSSFISSPVLNVTLPQEWVLGSNEQTEGSYYQFILRPAGDVDPHGPRISIELVNLAANGLQIADINDLKGVLPRLATIKEEPRVHSIGGYEVVRAPGTSEAEGAFFEYSLFLVNDRWVMVIFGGAYSEAEARATLPCVNTIIQNMNVVLPKT